jgi:hypothetical protein
MTPTLRILATMYVLAMIAAPAAADVHGVAFDPSPPGEWRCGLTNEDLPGLATERMTHPLAAACARGEARAFVVIVDLSDARHAMSSEQMADDAQDQLPRSWKISSKSYDVVSLPTGRTAAYSRLVGKGDGFTFLSGQTPTLAISFNVPLLFQGDDGAPRQAIAVFRVRSPLPPSGGQQKAIGDLDNALRAWAGTARPANNRGISVRDFEVAMLLRSQGGTTSGVRNEPAVASRPTGDDRIAAAVSAAVNGSASAEDLAVLESAGKQFGPIALGSMARSLRDDLQRSSLHAQQQIILSKAIGIAGDRAKDVLSHFLAAAIASGDSAGATAAVTFASARGWTLRDLDHAAGEAIVLAILQRKLVATPNDRAFFELPSKDLLTLVLQTKSVPAIEETARRDRDHWRMKNRHAPSKAVPLVQSEKTIGVLERQQAEGVYRFRPLTNLLDVVAAEP